MICDTISHISLLENIMFKKVLFAAMAVALALSVVSCAAKPDYTDVKGAIAKNVADITAFTAAVDAAADAKALAAAITTFVDAYKADMDAFAAVMAKHSEASKEVPADLVEPMKTLTDANGTMAAAMQKITGGAFAQDADVVAALQKFADLAAAAAAAK
jgi:hypothetical protein